MPRRRFSAGQTVYQLCEAEIEISRGLTIGPVCKKLEIAEPTYYKWRREYGGRRTDQAKHLKELELENSLLKKLIADQALDNAILKDSMPGKY